MQCIHVIFGSQVAHGVKICPNVFGDDVMHINEWAGLNDISTTVYPFCFIFGIIMLFASVHKLMVSKR